ncbi:MAG: DUF302 domain-containing protein [Betaproteobacteria bacterium]|nr:DUF302 domain-containing protein [Betaproteobacteria bacterium]
MKTLRCLLLSIAAIAWLPSAALADEMIIVRSSRDFEDTMSTLQNAITARGYKVSRVQRVDVGLEARGYQTDKYRVVFYGKADEVAALAGRHPELIPFLPLSVAIFAEGGQTLLATNRPRSLAAFFPAPELKPTFERWEKDLRGIFDEIRQAR